MKRDSQQNAPLFLPPSGKAQTGATQLLIISDCADRVLRLRAALSSGEVEITGIISTPSKLSCFLRRKYDLAIIDVGLGQIVKILKAVRSKAEYAGMHVLVECSRISTEPGFAGLLPQYRAMPCGHLDLVALVKSRLAPTINNQRVRGLL